VVCNIGGGSRVSVNQVLATLARILDRPLHVRYAGTECGDVRHTSADTGLAAQLLGYAPQVGLEAGRGSTFFPKMGAQRYFRDFPRV
jgi:nucleoside-diphosphate-sugar epimerase